MVTLAPAGTVMVLLSKAMFLCNKVNGDVLAGCRCWRRCGVVLALVLVSAWVLVLYSLNCRRVALPTRVK